MFRYIFMFLFLLCFSTAGIAEPTEKTAPTGGDLLHSSQMGVFEQIYFFSNLSQQISSFFTLAPSGNKVSVPESKQSHRKRYDDKFYHGLHLIYENSFVEAGDVFSELSKSASSDGYRNLTSYSYVLIDIARRFYEEGSIDQARFVTKYAIQMSPEDGRVLFAAMPFAGGEDQDSFVSYATKGISLLTRYPSVVVPFLSNILIVGLACVTITFLFTCLVQLSLHHKVINRVLFRHFPRAIQVWIMPIVFVVLLIAPIYFGLLPMLFIWSLVLSLSLSHGRWLAVLSCVLAVSWGLGIKVIAVTNENSQLRLNHALENVTSGNFVSKDADLLLDAASKFDYDPYVLFANGVLYYADGNYQKSSTYFDAVIKVATDKKTLRNAAIGNRGIIEYRLGNFDAAEDYLLKAQDLGVSKFELLRDLSLVSLAKADVQTHRQYYSQLKEKFDTRLKELEQREGDVVEPLLFLVPASSFLQSFFRQPTESKARDLLSLRENGLSKVLLRDGSPEMLSLLGVIGLLLVLPLLFRAKMKRFLSLYGSIEGKQRFSYLWLPVPGGVFITGKHPVAGMFALAVVLTLLALHSGMPIPLFTIFPFPLELGNILPIAAVMVFVATQISSIIFSRRAGGVSQC